MAQSILEDLIPNEANKLPGWSFVHFGASFLINHLKATQNYL